MVFYKIYDRLTLALADAALVRDFDVDFDYVANNTSTIRTTRESKGHKGDLIALLEGATLVALGVVTAIDNTDMRISFKHPKELFNDNVLNVFHWTNVGLPAELNKGFEAVQGLRTILEFGFVNTADPERRLPLEIRTFGAHAGAVWADDAACLNVVDFIDFLFDHYNIRVDFELDFINDRIVCTIARNTTSGLVLKDNIRLSKPEMDNNELPRENRAALFDKNTGRIVQMFYLLQNNDITTNVNAANRVLPPATRFIEWDQVEAIREGYTMMDLARSEIGGNIYNHCIKYQLSKTQNMVQPNHFRIGDQITIIYEGRSYDSIFTGLKFKMRDRFITCLFGKTRIDFTDRMKIHNNRRFAKKE